MASATSPGYFHLPPYHPPLTTPAKTVNNHPIIAGLDRLSRHGRWRVFQRGRRPRFPPSNAANANCTRFRLRRQTPKPPFSDFIPLSRCVYYEQRASHELVRNKRQLRDLQRLTRRLYPEANQASEIVLLLKKLRVDNLRAQIGVYRRLKQQWITKLVRLHQNEQIIMQLAAQISSIILSHLHHHLPP